MPLIGAVCIQFQKTKYHYIEGQSDAIMVGVATMVGVTTLDDINATTMVGVYTIVGVTYYQRQC